MKNFYLSDLDKTLLRSDLTISNHTKDIWNKAVENGVYLSIATARSLTGVQKLLKDLTLKEPLILLDGVVIADIKGNIISLSSLDRDISNEIIDIAKSIDMEPLLVAMDDDEKESFIYPKNPNIWQKELLSSFHNERRVLNSPNLRAMDRNLKIVFMESQEKTAELEELLKEVLGESIEIKRSADPYINCWFMTVLHPEGDKANALKKLEEIEGVRAENTTVFGDSHNDIGLFEYAGRKVAVANAIDELKKCADIVLPWSNDEDAVANFLEKELFG